MMKAYPDFQLVQGGLAQSDIEVWLENETVWLSQNQLSLLFQRDQTVISRHIRNVIH